MKIVQLTTENVKRISAVQITPTGNMVVIGGKNGAGKSSVLDSIMMALGGKALECERPVRDGAERGKTVIDLGDLVVTRTYTKAGGGTLAVTNKDGAVQKGPQAILDALTAKQCFDPLAFTMMEPKKQAETLRQLLRLDFTALDAKRTGLFSDRTEKNRNEKYLQQRIDAIQTFSGVPAEELKVDDLTKKLEHRRRQNSARAAQSLNVENLIVQRDTLSKKTEKLTSEIEAIDAEKCRQLEAAEFPVAGLSFDESGVSLYGVPFSQASRAEQLKVSVAMGLALNPKLKVLLIRDGSLLDDDSLQLIAEMAAASDAQVWMERVGKGKEVSVVIEDGAVAAEVGK